MTSTAAICDDRVSRVYYATRLTDHLTIEEMERILCGPDPAYAQKMMHPLPTVGEVKRERFILDRCVGKIVLDIGASGELHKGIVEVSSAWYGIDHPSNQPGKWPTNMQYTDLDVHPESVPNKKIDVIVCGEVIEHLSNPGRLLHFMRHYYVGATLLVSVPNAFSAIAQKWLRKGIENVNSDHVAWYSPKTLANLLSRAGWKIEELHCYNGASPYAEGWVALCK